MLVRDPRQGVRRDFVAEGPSRRRQSHAQSVRLRRLQCARTHTFTQALLSRAQGSRIMHRYPHQTERSHRSALHVQARMPRVYSNSCSTRSTRSEKATSSSLASSFLQLNCNHATNRLCVLSSRGAKSLYLFNILPKYHFCAVSCAAHPGTWRARAIQCPTGDLRMRLRACPSPAGRRRGNVRTSRMTQQVPW